jgi:hypothetical protein
VSVHNGDIILDSCLFQPTSAWRGMPLVTTTDYINNVGAVNAGRVMIRNSEFDGTLLDNETAAYATAFIGIADFQRNYIHHFGSGIGLMNTGTEFDCIIEDNYIEFMLATGDAGTTGNHSDTFTVRDFRITARPDRELIVRNNYFMCDSTNATGAFFIQPYAGRIANLVMQGNHLLGRGFNLGLEENAFGYENVVALNNRFTPQQYGATYRTGGSGWTTWTDNYIYSAVAANTAGTIVLAP